MAKINSISGSEINENTADPAEGSADPRGVSATAGDPYEGASLEEVFERLEETLSKMDSPDLPLEDAFALYEQGMKMVAAADGKLKKVEHKLTVINQQN